MLTHRIAKIGNGEYYTPMTEEVLFRVLSNIWEQR
jgi:hypothetical protein